MKINYASPWVRLARRFVVVGLSAALAFLFSKVDSLDPLAFINGLLGLSPADWLDLLKVFVGAGFLAGLDKLKRELPNLRVDNPPPPNP